MTIPRDILNTGTGGVHFGESNGNGMPYPFLASPSDSEGSFGSSAPTEPLSTSESFDASNVTESNSTNTNISSHEDALQKAQNLLSPSWPELSYADLDHLDAASRTAHLIDRDAALLEYFLTQALGVGTGTTDTSAVLTDQVRHQLRSYVHAIGHLYRSVPFHSFEHGSHCMLSAAKLATALHGTDDQQQELSRAAFLLVFSALIHDVDHRGVTNAQLVKEDSELLERYPATDDILSTSGSNRSVLERNSVDVAVDVLHDSQHDELRSVLMPLLSSTTTNENRDGLTRCLNAIVLPTDIASPELQASTKSKLNTALKNTRSSRQLQSTTVSPDTGLSNLTEAVIQTALLVADISHCTQSWETFVKWNVRLLDELNAAHDEGRYPMGDPNPGWFDGQIGFFDKYIEPLVTRLEETVVLQLQAQEDGDEEPFAISDNLRFLRARWAARGTTEEALRSPRAATAAQVQAGFAEAATAQPNFGPGPIEGGGDISISIGQHQHSKMMRRASNETAVSWSTMSSDAVSSLGSISNGYRRTNIWSKIAKNKEAVWADPEDLSYDSQDHTVTTCSEACKIISSQQKESIARMLRTLRSNPSIIFASLFVFAVLTTAGLLAVRQMTDAYSAEMLDKAQDVGAETAQWFKDEFDKLLMPMFTISQFVKVTDSFKDLPQQMAVAPPLGEEQSAYVDVRDVCTDPKYMDPFREIVDGIRNDSNLEGVLFNVRLAPSAVTCLVDRIHNSEDFEDGWSFDAEAMAGLGHNWLKSGHPMMESIIRETILDDVVTVAGPMPIGANSKPTKDPSTAKIKEFFCAHLAINMPGYEMQIDGEVRPTYGYVQVFFDWSKMKERSGVYGRFNDAGVLFKLTRTDRMYDHEADEHYTKEVIIAESPDSKAELLMEDNTEVIPVATSNGEWIMHVGYAPEDLRPSWENGMIACVVIAAFFFALIIAVVMVEKQRNKDLLYKMMPPSAVKKLHKGQTVVERFDNVTIFFSDIVGFTTMAGEMSPIEVMKMLNELYLGFDKLVDKHQVYKVETIGDAYMVIGGAPDRCTGTEAAEKVALFALDAMEFVKAYRTDQGEQIFIRAGLASGSVVAGVVGDKMPRYCFFGDTVNFASRMESTSKRSRIQASDLTKHLLMDAPNYHFLCEERREGDQVGVEVKGKGLTHTWWIRQSKERKNRRNTGSWREQVGNSFRKNKSEDKCLNNKLERRDSYFDKDFQKF